MLTLHRLSKMYTGLSIVSSSTTFWWLLTSNTRNASLRKISAADLGFELCVLFILHFPVLLFRSFVMVGRCSSVLDLLLMIYLPFVQAKFRKFRLCKRISEPYSWEVNKSDLYLNNLKKTKDFLDRIINLLKDIV